MILPLKDCLGVLEVMLVVIWSTLGGTQQILTGPGTTIIAQCSVVARHSAAQSYPPLCDLMDCSMPAFPVLHHLLEFAQIHVRRVWMLPPRSWLAS